MRQTLLAFLCCATVMAPAARGEQSEPTVSLRWAVGAIDSAGGKPTAIRQDSRLVTGAKLKLLVEPQSKGSVYLLLLDSSNELQVLYRKSSTVAQTAGGPPTYIPPGSQWFELEKGAGMETFFLLASVTPLKQLEQLLDRYGAADAAGKKAVATDVVDEVRRLNKANRNFARPVERPVMIGGQTRGTDTAADAIDQLAVEVEAERFYGKTITIDH
jgi:hypothetical protein